MAEFSVSKKSVRLILVGLIVMVAGYILLMGGGSDDPDVFNPAMFDFRRMVASPVLMICGIIVVIVAIMRKPAEKDGQ